MFWSRRNTSLALADSRRGVGDLLAWAHLIDDGILLNKDGSLLATLAYSGPDLDSSTEVELTQLSDQINRAFQQLGSEWILHVDAIRRPASDYPECPEWPAPVAALIDLERQQQYQSATNYQTDYYMTLTWLPPTDRQRKLISLVFAQSERRSLNLRQVLDDFRSRLADLEGFLSAGLRIRRLNGEQLLTFLHTTMTGLHHRILVPNKPFDLDRLLFTATLYGGLTPRIGEQHIRVVAIGGLPFHSEPALLDRLNRLPFAFRWSSRFLPIDPDKAKVILTSLRLTWFQGATSMKDAMNQHLAGDGEKKARFTDKHAENMGQEADDALALASSSTVRYGWYTPVLVVTSPSAAEADTNAQRLEKEIRNLGFSSSLIETFNALEAWLGSLPGHGRYNVRRPLIHTLNLADLLPVTSIWAGDPKAPLPALEGQPALFYARTTASTPFYFNLHHDDVGHALILGPTGTGKSTLLGLLLAQWMRYPSAEVYVFDRGYSALPLTLACGGKHYDIASGEDSGVAFAPLSHVDEQAERGWLADWFELIFQLNGPEITPLQRRELENALINLSGQLVNETSPVPNLRIFNVYLQDNDLRRRIAPYLLGNAQSANGILDAHIDGFSGGRWHVFEMGHLLEYGDRLVIPVLSYLFYRIRRRLRGQPTLIVLDEAWAYLKNPLFAARIEQWLKELRKLNAAIVFASQSLADVVNSPQRDSLLESTPTKIFLANPEAATAQGEQFYTAIGLNKRQIQLIAGAIPKREYYYTSPRGSRLIDLNLGPLALSFLGIAARDQQRALDALIHSNLRQEPWQAAWLRHRNLPEWANAFNAHNSDEVNA